ncbi:MAG: hypothetical protein PHQ14_10020 [Chromatiales bacterium]|jgi:hypothetical protein|nr:hypothetical protein [Chromatiales bacterium]MDX9766616.1 hypothetical protein [Ectothiorhodospiraceae bacterium]
MTDSVKTILVIAQDKKTEALRMASGLTLLDDRVQVSVLGDLEDSDAVNEQLEALDFADVVVDRLDPAQAVDMAKLATQVGAADAVYMI